jgi:hypothetical protein
MRKMKKLTGFISLLIFIPSINSFAIEKVAQTGCKFLDVAAGARACGMGEAYTVLGQDANALFYNPSCIGEIDKNFDLAVGRTEWIAEIDYISVAGVINGGVWGNFGFSVIAPDYGEIEGTRISTENEQGYIMTGLLDVNAFCAGVGYAREFTEKFTVGAQVKYVAQQLGWNVVDEDTVDNEISTLSYDFGLLFYPGFKSFAFGMSVRNFSPRVTYEQIGFEMPLTFTLGVGVDIMDFLVENPNYSFKIGAEMLHPRDWQEQFHLGGEFGYMDMIFLRAGYKFRYSQEGLNLGVGLNIAGAKIDYSYSEFELFDIINRISVGFAF